MKNRTQQNITQRIVIAALLAAVTCVVTMIVKIPSPLKGYLNLGDWVVLIAGWMLSPMYGFLAAGLGSVLVAFYGYKLTHRKLGNLPARIMSGTVAEIVMILGYFLFEGILYGFGPSVVNIPANAVQGVAGLVLGIILMKVFEKWNCILVFAENKE